MGTCVTSLSTCSFRLAQTDNCEENVHMRSIELYTCGFCSRTCEKQMSDNRRSWAYMICDLSGAWVMCSYGELVRARVFCVYSTIWHARGYLRCYDNLASVRVQAFVKQVSFRNITLWCSNEELQLLRLLATLFLEEGDRRLSAIDFGSTYISDTINCVQQHDVRSCFVKTSW